MARNRTEASLWGGRVTLSEGRPRPGGLWGLLLLWQARMSERATLREMSDHQLRDIGLSRREIESEAGKPFWRE